MCRCLLLESVQFYFDGNLSDFIRNLWIACKILVFYGDKTNPSICNHNILRCPIQLIKNQSTFFFDQALPTSCCLARLS
ncbi:hypothetical protein BDA96_07G077300 [Sorghum bicolor]|uniref:Uncharacterized protein n=2 Tax=Sorghum bicolor TaxID=4558 RepID=A0A921U9S7_SORBI|nr:hypothetical protein BDA96_07G077300 [Sorghum bicolor]KXG24700.1 hypothetical protein SORBI_3007G074100 [Sorghum bicolor]